MYTETGSHSKATTALLGVAVQARFPSNTSLMCWVNLFWSAHPFPSNSNKMAIAAIAKNCCNRQSVRKTDSRERQTYLCAIYARSWLANSLCSRPCRTHRNTLPSMSTPCNTSRGVAVWLGDRQTSWFSKLPLVPKNAHHRFQTRPEPEWLSLPCPPVSAGCSYSSDAVASLCAC